MEKKRRKKEKKEIKEEIPEIFEIEKDGEKKTIEVYGKEEEKPSSKEQIKKENKIFRNVIIVMIGLVLMFLAVYIIIYFSKHFDPL